MSISSAMHIAVSGLKAQSKALSVVSQNLSNSGTVGYKAATTSFSSLVSQMYNGNNFSGAGVTASARQHISDQGTLDSTSRTTDLALDGKGMFVVRYGNESGNDSVYYTRNGEFQPDENGDLVNNNYYLMGWPTDENGNVIGDKSTSNLQRVNVKKNISSVKASDTATIKANLGPSTKTNGTSTSSMEVYDSLGNVHTVSMKWEKTGTNAWNLTFSSKDGTTTLGTTALKFDGNGKLTTPSTGKITMPFKWNNGSNDSSISVDLSNINQTYKSTGVEQVSATTNGHTTGKLLGVVVDESGSVTATYDNGQSIPIYKVAVATFSNYDGLSSLSHGIYQESRTSGHATYHTAGSGGSAVVKGSKLERSTVSTADEFTRMIEAQQAYSAASQVISSAKDMFDSLISTVR